MYKSILAGSELILIGEMNVLYMPTSSPILMLKRVTLFKCISVSLIFQVLMHLANMFYCCANPLSFCFWEHEKYAL